MLSRRHRGRQLCLAGFVQRLDVRLFSGCLQVLALAVQALATSAERRGRFVRDLPGSGALHWGDGTIMMNANKIWLDGTISPGPDYRLYLAPEFVDDGVGFLAIKAELRQIGTVKTFENFALDLPPAIDLVEYDAVVIWCEAFK